MTLTKLKIAVIAPNYRKGGLGGTQTYFDELINDLSKNKDLEITIFCPKDAFASGINNCETKSVFPKIGKYLGPIPSVLKMRSPQFINEINRFDIAFLPLTVSVNLKNIKIPTILALHDVQHLDLPENFEFAEKIFRKFTYDRPALSADHVVTISEFSKNQILNNLKISAKKVHVIYNGVSSNFKDMNTSSNKAEFLIYPARDWPHKNHQRLFQAIRELKTENVETKLILTGKPPQVPEDLKNNIENLGQVSVEKLNSLYQNAKGLIFPSLYEGFGLPIIEAMTYGCPVASSRYGSLPEICDDAAYLFDPTSVEEIKKAIIFLISDSHEMLIKKGYENAQRFTWAKASKEYENLFFKVALKVA